MAIELYDLLLGNPPAVRKPVVTKSPEEVSAGYPIIEDARDITLSQYLPETKECITAHRIKDYRRRGFNMILLPEVRTLFDDYLEGCTFYEQKLRTESPYC